MVEWPKITAKIIFNLKTFAPTNCGEKCLLKLFPPKETRLPKMPYRSLKSSTSLKCYLSIRPTAPPSHPNGRLCESLSPLASDWGGGVGGWRDVTFQASQALAALDSELKACVVGKISFYLQPASLTFFALFLFGRYLLGFMLVEQVLFAKCLGL